MIDWEKKIKYNSELITCLAIFWIITIVFLIQSITLNHGHLIYTLDDAYIHMAIAKNYSQYGVWGITNNEFSSTSSSLLFTLLLSFTFFIFGPNEIIPLIINLIFANLLIYMIFIILKKNNLPSYFIIVALLLIIFFLPLHSLVFIGMEHILQIVIDIYFTIISSKILSENNLGGKKKRFSKNDKLLFFLSPLVTMVRFEGMFLIIIFTFLFILRKKKVYAILIAGFGFFPIIIYGLISMSNGWFFLPNSVVLKSSLMDFNNRSLIGILKLFIPNEISDFSHLLILLIGAFIIMYNYCLKKNDPWNELSIIAFVFISVTFCQLSFADIFISGIYGSRYDAYIVAIGLILIFLSIKKGIPQGFSIFHIKSFLFRKNENFEIIFFRIITISLILTAFYAPFANRCITTLKDVPKATNNIYEQQYQMGLFLNKYYEGDCVAVNDIGAINYLADIEILDLKGLGSIEVARAKINDVDLDEDTIYNIAKKRDCKIAIIYEKDGMGWGYNVPTQWIKAGDWKIKDNRVCGSSSISFFAVDYEEYNNLILNLKDFSRYLPNSVEQSGNYTATDN